MLGLGVACQFHQRPLDILLLLVGFFGELALVGWTSYFVWRRCVPWRFTGLGVSIVLHTAVILILCLFEESMGAAAAGISLLGPSQRRRSSSRPSCPRSDR